MASEIPDLGQSGFEVREFCASVKQEMDSLKREVESLASRLSAIEHDRPAAMSGVSFDLTSNARIAEVARLTEAIFSRPEISVEHDPEEPEAEYVVFTVRLDCEPREGVQKHIEWHRRIEHLATAPGGDFRLSIVPAQ